MIFVAAKQHLWTKDFALDLHASRPLFTGANGQLIVASLS